MDRAEVKFSTATQLNTLSWLRASMYKLDNCWLILHIRCWVCYCKSFLPKLSSCEQLLGDKGFSSQKISLRAVQCSLCPSLTPWFAHPEGLGKHKITASTSFLAKDLPGYFHFHHLWPVADQIGFGTENPDKSTFATLGCSLDIIRKKIQ